MTTRTSIYLDKEASGELIQGLTEVLADTYLIYVKTQGFHWNVVDSRFHSLHKMFEEQYQELANSVDDLAERIRMLKGRSPGSMAELLQNANIEESQGNFSGNEMIAELCKNRETMIGYLRRRIEEAQKLGDEGTADLYIQQLRQHEKASWMLRSHLG